MATIDAVGTTIFGVPEMKVIYSGVRAEMARRDVSQQDLAQQLGVHYNTISNWLRGGSDPGLGSVIQALKAIGMSEDEILNMRLRELITLRDETEAPA